MSEHSSDLFFATMVGDVEAARNAIASGAEVNLTNSNGMTPLLVCSGGMGPPSMMSLLLESGAQVDLADRQGWTPLVFVASSGQLPLVELLVKAGADVNVQCSDRGWTPLTRAAYRGHAHVIRALLHAGADPSVSSEGKSPWQWAAEGGHAEAQAALSTADPVNVG